MTLIAAIRVGECPILLGDLLLASELKTSRPLALPTLGKLPENFQLRDPYQITGTSQKISIVSPRLTVAWSGRRIYAHHIIRNMKIHFSKRSIDYDSLEKFFNSQKRKYLDDLQFICWFDNIEKGLNSFGVNTVNIDTEKYGHCHVGGTGAGDLIDLLYATNQFEQIQGAPSIVQRGVGQTLALVSNILANEIRTGANLATYYGGGMEIATYRDGCFQKIGDILHLFWVYGENENKDSIRFIPTIYKVDYLKENLVIRRLSIGFNEDKANIEMENYSTFVLSPVLKCAKNKIKDLRDLRDLNAKFFVNHILVKGKDGNYSAKATIHYSHARESPFRITQTKAGFVASFHKEFFQGELERVKRRIW